MSDLQRRLHRGKAPAHLLHDDEEADGLPELGSGLNSSRRRLHASEDLSPLSADQFFEEALEVESEDDVFRVYRTPPKPERADHPDEAHNGTLVVCHHGANYTGLSFACFAAELRKATRGELGCLAFDARGHGRTSLRGPQPPPLSLDGLANDLVRVLKSLYPDRASAPTLLLVGHSMGGPVVVEACERVRQEVASVVGVAVLDAVEGSALEAIQGMTAFIAAQPKGFESVQDAIEWHLDSKTLSNPVSARVSVPALVKATPDAAHSVSWRTDLAASQPFWQNWFEGLSSKFLGIRAAKLLVLAGTDRLDKPMMIGQMQGKYQLTVWPDVGHCLQEDAPERLAATIIEFWRRNDTTDILKHVKKVGQ